MATRIFAFRVSLNAGQSNDGQGTDPSPFSITVPSGIKRTIVELRPYGDDSFVLNANYDTELYHSIDSDDINTYHRPHFVGLDITETHVYTIIMTNRGTATGNFGVDVVVEETVTGTAAPAPA
jgi:hypothetical protein